jgi:hypothetical protein
MRLSVFLFLFAAAASGQCPPGGTCQAPVDRKAVPDNTSGRQCAWVSLSALANRAGQPALAAAALAHPGPLRSVSEVEGCCAAAGVKCEANGGSLSDFLTKHVTDGHRPVAIGVHSGRHVVLCTHFEAGKCVGTVGNNPGGGEPRLWDWNEFNSVLRPDGLAFCLPGDGGAKTDKAAPCKKCADKAGGCDCVGGCGCEAKPAIVAPPDPRTYYVAPVVVHPPAVQMPAYCPPGGT